MNFKERFKKHWKTNLIFLLVSLLLGTGIFLAMFFMYKTNLGGAVDGCFVSGAALIGFGLLCMVAREGFFDFLSYGFLQVGHSWFNRHEPAKYDDYVQYRNIKKDKRSVAPDYFLGILAAGLLFLLGALVLYIIWKAQIA